MGDVTPLWAVMLFTFLNSIGSGVSNAGIFFLAESKFGFGKEQLLGMGLLYGVTYIPAAMLVGPLLRRLPAGHRWASPRTMLGAVMLVMAASCALPAVLPQGWTLWVFMAVYSVMAGMLWPVVESYVSGGRSAAGLRSAIGRFNVTWSSALVVALFGMAPFIRSYPLGVLGVLAGVHVVGALSLIAFAPRPGEHAHADHEPHPEVYTRLLAFVRVLLPTAFMFLAALAPYLPIARGKLGLAETFGPMLAATWMSARVATFFVLERWHGWHGRWTTPVAGVGCLLVGFAGSVLAPGLGGAGTLGVGFMLAGLATFGVGVGIIYCAALYYAMEVGGAEVDAGGTHEMLIGVGYTVGPLCGLIGVWTSQRASGGIEAAEHIMLGLISLVGVVATAVALARARSMAVRA